MRAALSSLSIAISALGAAKLRTTLTALGILIGIAAVVVVAALGTGASERIGGQMESLGSNLLFIWAQPATKSGARVRGGTRFGLSDDDAETIGVGDFRTGPAEKRDGRVDGSGDTHAKRERKHRKDCEDGSGPEAAPRARKHEAIIRRPKYYSGPRRFACSRF